VRAFTIRRTSRRRRSRLSWRRVWASSGVAGRRLSFSGGARDLGEESRAGWFIAYPKAHEGKKERKKEKRRVLLLQVPEVRVSLSLIINLANRPIPSKARKNVLQAPHKSWANRMTL